MVDLGMVDIDEERSRGHSTLSARADYKVLCPYGHPYGHLSLWY